MEAENYHDYERVNQSKDHILELWEQLLALLKARRIRLDANKKLQIIFNEMIDILDGCSEIEQKHRSEDRGQHLMDVEDLLQKHAMALSDLHAINKRVEAVNQAAEPFAQERSDPSEYRPTEPGVVRERQEKLRDRVKELYELSEQRARDLEDNRRLCQFWWDLADSKWLDRYLKCLYRLYRLNHSKTTTSDRTRF